jgi:hypothetical protein
MHKKGTDKMLASLLPGLRDVRTPLGVGYSWILICWILFSSDLPTSRPSGDGPIASLYDLEELIGKGSVLAALSFISYLLGAVIVFPVEGATGTRLTRVAQKFMRQSHSTQVELSQLRQKLQVQIANLPSSVPEAVRTELHAQNTAGLGSDDLRTRLLVANQSLYGEYDRLSAEAAFRLNITPPLLVLSIIAGINYGWFWILIGGLTSLLLAIQGLRRGALARDVLLRAVIAGVIELPVVAEVRSTISNL